MEPYQNLVPRKLKTLLNQAFTLSFLTEILYISPLWRCQGARGNEDSAVTQAGRNNECALPCLAGYKNGIQFLYVAERCVCSSESEWRNLWFQGDVKKRGGRESVYISTCKGGRSWKYLVLTSEHEALFTLINSQKAGARAGSWHQRYKGSDSG